MIGMFDKPELGPCKVELWPFQERAVEAVFAEFRKGIRRTLVNMATGTGKCVSPETLVWSDGLRTFGDAWGASRIAGPHGPAAVSGWYDDGVREGLKATLECGLEIDGTPAHRVWVRFPDGTEGWQYMMDLQEGDFVAVARGHADFGKEHLSREDAYLLGLVVADGCLVKCCSWRLQIDKHRRVLEAISGTLNDWKMRAGGNGNGVAIKDDSENHSHIEAHSLGFQSFLLDEFGLDFPAYSNDREVPEKVLRGDRDTVRAFLRGYFDGDGYCSPTVACSTSSPKLAGQIHQLLIGLGIFASRRMKMVNGGLPAHIIEINDVEAFDREVGFTPYGLTKDVAYAVLLKKPRNTNVDTVPWVGSILKGGAARLRSKHRRTDGWKTISSYFDSRKKPGYDKLRSLIHGLPDWAPEKAELQRIVDEHRIWSPVKSIEASTIRRIDCEVAEQHAFVGNGIVNHNTVVAASIIRRGNEHGRKVLFLAHTDELIQQTAGKLDLLGVQPAVEQGEEHARAYWRNPDAVVASVMTLIQPGRLESWPEDSFDLIIVDEGHRIMGESYKRILAHFRNAKVIVLTATPLRLDEQELGHIVESVAFRFSVLDAWNEEKKTGQQYLCDIRMIKCDVGVDLKKLKPTRQDFCDSDTDARIAPMMEIICNKVREHIGADKTVAFWPSIRAAQAFAGGMRSLGFDADAVWGSDPDRANKIRRYRSEDMNVLSNMNLLVEGWDVPETTNVVLGRNTQSWSMVLQQIGRGLRAGKPYCRVLDLQSITDQFGETPGALFVQPLGILGGEGFDREVNEILAEKIRTTPELSMKAAIEEAEHEAEDRKRLKQQFAVRMAIAERKIECVEDQYSVKELIGDGEVVVGSRPVVQKGFRPATDGQKRYLAHLGVYNTDNWSFERAGCTISKLKQQREGGVADVKERKRLIRDGVHPDQARETTCAQASAYMDQLEQRRQKVYGNRRK